MMMLAFGGAKDDAGGTECKEGAIGNKSALFGGKFDIINEGASITVIVL